MRVQQYEGIYYLLIDKDNGTEVKVLSEPVFSETGKYFACYNATCAGDDAGLQIFEVINKNKFKLIANELKNHFWDPSFVKWKGDNQLLFETNLQRKNILCKHTIFLLIDIIIYLQHRHIDPMKSL